MSISTARQFILVIMIGLLTTGCAHKRLIDDGEDFDRAGRYELAVNKYKKALALKPKDSKTQKKLQIAQNALDNWLEQLLVKADTAFEQGLNGRAMVLYSKVAQLSDNPHALAQYKMLHKTLKDQARYHLLINAPQQLGKNLGRQLADVTLVKQIDSQASNHFRLKVNAAKPSFKTTSQIKEVTQEYVSGVETVANPEFINLQDDINEQREQLDHYHSEYDHKLSDTNNAQHSLISFEKDLEIARLRLSRANPNSNNYRYWQGEVDRLHHQVTHYQRLHSDLRHQLDDINQHIAHGREQLDQALNALSYLEPTALQDIYSEHVYQVEQVTRKASGKLNVAFSGSTSSDFNHKDLNRSKTITAKAVDDGHQEQPLLNLDFNPISLPSDNKITNDYHQNSAEQVNVAIKQHLRDYRNHLRLKANRQNGIDEKLEAWVHYGLSDSMGVDDGSQNTIKRQLEQEYGIAGEFNINRLLYLFGY